VGAHKHITWKNYGGKDGAVKPESSETELNKISIVDCADQQFVFTGKVQGILLDNCKNVSIQVDSVISCLEVCNSDKSKIYVQKAAPTVSIDGCQGAHVYLWDEAKEAQVVTSKSSELNVSVQTGDEFKECALPEQFVQTWCPKTQSMICKPTEQLGV